MALALMLIVSKAHPDTLLTDKAHPDTLLTDVEGDAAPYLLVEPQYPPEALRNRVEGYVELQLLIGTDGSVLRARITESSPGCVFEVNTLRAVRLWKFKPRVVDGVTVNRWAETKIVFQLNDRRSPRAEKPAAMDGDILVEIPLVEIPKAEDLPLEEAVPILLVEPMYPRIQCVRASANADVKGYVEFKVLISTGGSVRKLCVIENTLSPLFERPAANALRQSRFNPLLHNDVPIERWASARIAFDYSRD